jgi:hypothetical protein
MVMVMGLGGLQPPALRAQDCIRPTPVSNQAELNAAITCYNAVTTPGEYGITLTADIALTASTMVINNANVGVSLRIDGAGFTVDGQGGFNVRPFTIAADTVVTIDSIELTRSNSHTQGGAIANRGTLTVINSTITGNSTTTEGGGIGNKGGTLTVINSTISGNIAWFDGGGIASFDGSVIVINSTISGNSADFGGGGILNDGTLTITASTISNNSANSGGGINNSGLLIITASTISSNTAGNGGGIYNERDGKLTSINNTFSGNRANGLGGGGIDNYSGTLNLINNTFSGNSASAGSGIYHQTGWLYMVNTILSSNLPSGHDCLLVGDVYENWMSPAIGNNLIESTGEGACRIPADSNGNILGQTAQLGPLQDNGGPTLTHAPLAGSPALNAGNNTVCADPATVNNLDQRGVTRPQGEACDIGAFEMQRRYNWSGFFAPVDNRPVINTVNAGQAIPLKFNLGGDFGLDIFAPGDPSSHQVACASGGASSSPVEETLTAGKSGLQYDLASGLYTYVWKTDKSWAGTCRLLTLRLNDGAEHSAFFQFQGKGGRSASEQAQDEAANALYLPLITR